MARPILEQLKDGPVLGDGGYVVILRDKRGVPFEEWAPHGILTHGDKVRQLYQEFFDAGAEVIIAQTFFGTRNRLERVGHGDKFEEIHRLAVDSAREVVGDRALVAGTVTSVMSSRRNLGTLEDAYTYGKEEAELLVDLGVDFLMLEGLWHVDESLRMLKAVKEAAEPAGKAVMISLAFRTEKTMDGYSPADCARILKDQGADIVGVHCERDPENMFPIVEQIRNAVDGPVAMQPVAVRCAPFAVWTQGHTTRWYERELPPEAMADFARKARDVGIEYIGSCCGSGPEHVRAMAQAMGKPIRA